MTTRSVLEIQDGDPLCKVSVPGTAFVIVPKGLGSLEARIERDDGVVVDDLTRRMLERFSHWPRNAATARAIAGWLREGAP